MFFSHVTYIRDSDWMISITLTKMLKRNLHFCSVNGALEEFILQTVCSILYEATVFSVSKWKQHDLFLADHI